MAPHTGFVIRLGNDLAGLGGDEHYLRSKIDSTYFIPLDYFTGNASWGISLSQGAGYLYDLQSKEDLIDRFFLGGDNLRGFLDQGVGPHSVAYSTCLVGVASYVAGRLSGGRHPLSRQRQHRRQLHLDAVHRAALPAAAAGRFRFDRACVRRYRRAVGAQCAAERDHQLPGHVARGGRPYGGRPRHRHQQVLL